MCLARLSHGCFYDVLGRALALESVLHGVSHGVAVSCASVRYGAVMCLI